MITNQSSPNLTPLCRRPGNAAARGARTSHDTCLPPTRRPPPSPPPPPLQRADVDLSVTAIEQRPIALDDLLAAREAMLVSSVYGVVGLTCVDETLIGDGAPGVITLACHEALTLDRERADSSRHTRVPYGALTGMPSQLV